MVDLTFIFDSSRWTPRSSGNRDAEIPDCGDERQQDGPEQPFFLFRKRKKWTRGRVKLPVGRTGACDEMVAAERDAAKPNFEPRVTCIVRQRGENWAKRSCKY